MRAVGALFAVVVSAAAVGCADRSAPPVPGPVSPPLPPGPAPTPTPPPPDRVPEVGACHNIDVDSPCTFVGINRVDPDVGLPVPIDAPLDRDGTVTFAVGFTLTQPDSPPAELWVRGSRADQPALEQYYREHRETRCAGVIIRAPCPPGVHVVPQLPPPPVGTIARQP